MGSSSRVGDENSLLDLTEKVAVVTGAKCVVRVKNSFPLADQRSSSGIGLYILFHVARAGARVYLGARTEDKFNSAITRLKTEGLNTSKVVWLPFDLSDPRKAKESAKWLLERESRLDILSSLSCLISGRKPFNLSYSQSTMQQSMIVLTSVNCITNQSRRILGSVRSNFRRYVAWSESNHRI